MMKKEIVLLLTIALISIKSEVFGQEKTFTRVVSEKIIAEIDSSSWISDSFTISPDNKRVAYVGRIDNYVFVNVDGHKEKGDDLKEFVLSQIAPTTSKKDINNLIFSPDSKHLAYITTLTNQAIVLNEGKYGGTTLIKKQFVVVDGKEHKQYDRIGEGSIVFSPDNKHMAYTAKIENKWYVVVDGKEGKPYDFCSNIVFSPNSRRMAYAAKLDKSFFVVVDGKKNKSYDGIFSTIPITFSPDSKRIAYAAYLNEKAFIVIDGKEGKLYDSFVKGSLIFSPNGEHVAYAVGLDKKAFVVIDENEGGQYLGAAWITFSPDNKRIAYVAVPSNKKFTVVLDGKEEKRYDAALSLTFSPDSRRLAYVAYADNKYFIVLDGKEQKKFDFVWAPTFSPDSKRIAYVANISKKKWFVVVDTQEGKSFDSIITDYITFGTFGSLSKIIFDSLDCLRYLAVKKNNICLVEEKIE